MAAYVIGYDLHPSKGETYNELIEAIKSLGRWWHHLDSTWIVLSAKNAVQIRDSLLPYLKADDQLLVVQSAGVAAWVGFNDKGSDWLKTNI